MALSPITKRARGLTLTESCEDISGISGDPVSLYVGGLSIEKTARQVGWTRERTRKCLNTAGVIRSSGMGVHLAKCATPFEITEEIVELVDGLLLGDAYIEVNCVSGRLSIGQSGGHRPWVRELQRHLERLGVLSTIRATDGNQAIIKGKLCTRKPKLVLRTLNYAWFLEQHLRWYPGGKKVVPTDVRLTRLSITGWLCGDGVRAGKGYRIEFCTDNFPVENVVWLATELQKRFGWATTISDRNRIVLCRQPHRDALLAMVTPLVPDCFKYKLNLKTRSPQFKLDAARLQEMARLRVELWSYNRLAKHFEVTKSTIHAAMKKLGLTGTRVPRSSTTIQYPKNP